MSRRISQALAAWLDAGQRRIGEVSIAVGPDGYELRHHLDAEVDSLPASTGGTAAREIALYDAEGKYRPLKTAPNLRRGWRLLAPNLDALQDALDGFYPAMLAARFALQEDRLRVTMLRDTLGRQSGMYAITRKITDDQANTLIAQCCNLNTGCLKKILWRISPEIPITSLPPEKFDTGPSPQGHESANIPMPCAEACNLLVAKAREVVKQSPPPP